MMWIVAIEGKKNERVQVLFDPIDDMMSFLGQCKIKLEWKTFSTIKHSTIGINHETITKLIYDAYVTMSVRLNTYNELSEAFVKIKTIEIVE